MYLQALEPTAGVNLGALKEKVGNKIAFMGGIDYSHALFWDTEEVATDVQKCIKAADSRGYILGYRILFSMHHGTIF